MSITIPKITNIFEEEKTPLVLMLLEIIHTLKEENQQLKDEIARLKGQKPRPKIKPSQLEKPVKKNKKSDKKRAGSAKRKKTKEIVIHKEEVCKPEQTPPEGSRFKGYQDFVVQDIKIEAFNTKYRIERWETPDGKSLIGKLPAELNNSHFGPNLKSFIIYQYYHSHVTQPLLLEQLDEWGIDISSGMLNDILISNKEDYHKEKDQILAAGLEVSNYINVDDTGARHKGKNGYCTHIGNELFAWFQSTESKSRINFLDLLRTGHTDYVINADAISYMASQGLPIFQIGKLSDLMPTVFKDMSEWKAKLDELDITSPRHIQIATEGAMLGSLFEHNFNRDIVIISDDAGQFNILRHALCWIHAERTINKLVGFNEEQREALDTTRSEIWDLYTELKQFRENPEKDKKSQIEAMFDRIFTKQTCFQTLNQALKRIYNNKSELLLVLEQPDIPLHNNLSESDIREYVKKRKISGSTRSNDGRRCRDTFTSLKKTCRKLGVSFWKYIKDRVEGKRTVPYLPDLLRATAFNSESLFYPSFEPAWTF